MGDHEDRETAIADFKNGVADIMIATSIMARGLDLKDLNLVINYDTPNHYEEYVQRVGRTGRAGRKGTAITFLDPNDEINFVPDLARALSESGQIIPLDLQNLVKLGIQKIKIHLQLIVQDMEGQVLNLTILKMKIKMRLKKIIHLFTMNILQMKILIVGKLFQKMKKI